MPNAVVMDNCILGDRVWLNPGAIVGGQGFGFVEEKGTLRKVPQTSMVEIGDDVEIGANSCIDRGAMGSTTVGSGSKLDNLVQVGHGAQIGEGSVLVAYSGVAGSSRLGEQVTLAARSSVLGHLEVGNRVKVAAHSMVSKDIQEDAVVSGVPAQDHRAWLREQALLRRLEQMEARIRALESAQR
jgi:UDP-3-O-[3-hydroxymyristoyl] glucosamine N-acyltransferase